MITAEQARRNITALHDEYDVDDIHMINWLASIDAGIEKNSTKGKHSFITEIWADANALTCTFDFIKYYQSLGFTVEWEHPVESNSFYRDFYRLTITW